MQVCLRPSITANALHKHLSSISIPPSPLALPSSLPSLLPYSGPDCTHRLRFGNTLDAPCRSARTGRAAESAFLLPPSLRFEARGWTADGTPVMQQQRVKNTPNALSDATASLPNLLFRRLIQYSAVVIILVSFTIKYQPMNNAGSIATTGPTVSLNIHLGSYVVTLMVFGSYRFSVAKVCLAMHFPENNRAFKPRALYFLLSVCFESEVVIPDSRMDDSFESILFDELLKRASV